MNEWLKFRLHAVLQRILLSVPYLSEGRLASSKVMAFLRAWHYLERARVPGDYLEFGVWQGMSFALSLRSAAKFLPKRTNRSPRFFAFDSFLGLPKPSTDHDGTSFHEGEYRSARQTFEKNIAAAASGWEIHIISGYYEESLLPELLANFDMRAAAFVNIDCDLYQSTLTALRFVFPLLRTGSVLLFDDWFFSNGDMTRGEPGACEQWLKENPKIKLVDFGSVGIMGKMFIVNISAD